MIQGIAQCWWDGPVVLCRHNYECISLLDLLIDFMQDFWCLGLISVKVQWLLENRQVQVFWV